jgi:hypothetical protein
MEKIVIISLCVMLLIALKQLISKNFDNEDLSNKLDAQEKANICNVKKQKDLQSQIERLKSNLEIREKALKKAKESDTEYRNSKYTELETKYKSSLVKINERDDVIRLRDLEIVKLEKTKKEYSARVYELSNEKAIAIKETRSAVKLCKESVATVAQLTAELDKILQHFN